MELANKLKEQYLIGTSDHWLGATVFWQIDRKFTVKAGKIILYDPSLGTRIKKPYNHITWMHKVLSLKNHILEQCLFGEHLLENDTAKPIAIVESEKTAIIASVYMPQFIWLACGGFNNLNYKLFSPLVNRTIMLFPDLNCFNKWKQNALEIQKLISCRIKVFDLLELNATENDKSKGFDLADFLVRRDQKLGWALSSDDYPLFWDK